jgi:hypothetical protein
VAVAGARVELHEAHTFLDELPGEQALPSQRAKGLCATRRDPCHLADVRTLRQLRDERGEQSGGVPAGWFTKEGWMQPCSSGSWSGWCAR